MYADRGPHCAGIPSFPGEPLNERFHVCFATNGEPLECSFSAAVYLIAPSTTNDVKSDRGKSVTIPGTRNTKSDPSSLLTPHHAVDQRRKLISSVQDQRGSENEHSDDPA